MSDIKYHRFPRTWFYWCLFDAESPRGSQEPEYVLSGEMRWARLTGGEILYDHVYRGRVSVDVNYTRV
jgi:hypothetical protein